jgi:hypothetical protein
MAQTYQETIPRTSCLKPLRPCSAPCFDSGVYISLELRPSERELECSDTVLLREAINLHPLLHALQQLQDFRPLKHLQR